MSTGNPIEMWKFVMFVIFIMKVSVPDGVDAMSVVTTCPKIFEQGENHVNCTIDSALFQKECSIPGSIVDFALTVNGPETSACSTNPSYNPPSCTPSSSGETCGCQSGSGDTLTYFLKFQADRRVHDGGSLRCKIGCLAGVPSIGPACPIAFDTSSLASITCPKQFKEGEQDVECTVDTEKVAAAFCNPAPSELQYVFDDDGENPVCNANYQQTSCTLDSKTCGCRRQDGNMFTYGFKLDIRRSTHHGKKIQCVLPCLGTSIQVGAACEMNVELSPWMIALIILGSLALCAVIFIILYWLCGLKGFCEKKYDCVACCVCCKHFDVFKDCTSCKCCGCCGSRKCCACCCSGK